jgi:hypothetical protein
MKVPLTFRFLGLGWWFVHLIGMSLVYFIGARLL